MKKTVCTVCIDLNGVLDMYSGWKGEGHMDPPRPGADWFLAELSQDYKVVVFTTQPAEQVWEWLREHRLAEWVDEVTDRKVPAVAYIDDRAVTFRGDFEETLREIRAFRPYWRQSKETKMSAKEEAKAILKSILGGVQLDLDLFVDKIVEAAAEEVAARLKEGIKELEEMEGEAE